MANAENLIPFDERTESEQREIEQQTNKTERHTIISKIRSFTVQVYKRLFTA